LPGGACCFDLPALHHWLHRETGRFITQQAHNGFYQSDAEEANILRLNIPMQYGVYPMISGHKNRFAIKFIEFKSGQASAYLYNVSCYTGDNLYCTNTIYD